MTSEYTKKLIEDLLKINEERKKELSEIDIDEIVEEILNPVVDNRKEIAHFFICMNENVAKEINVLPKNKAKVFQNILYVRNYDDYIETKDSSKFLIDGVYYEIPRKYSFSIAFVE